MTLVLAITVGAGGLAAWRQGWFSSDAAPSALSTTTITASPTSIPSSEAVETSPATAPTPTEPTPTEPTPAELRAKALSELEQMVADDRNQSPVRGQWVAQLASKSEGTIDTTQHATPFTLPDVLAEIRSLRSNKDYGAIVRVVHQGDWGRTKAGSKPMWVTFADIDVTSKAEVVAWCKDHFSKRGDALLNVCYPRQMKLKS